MNSTYKWIIGLVVALVVIVWGYSAMKSPGIPVSTEPIKIGAIFPLTGSLAYSGEFDGNSAKIAGEDINAAGGINGRKLQIMFEDSAGNLATAVSAVNKLIQVDNVDAFLSSLAGVSAAISPVIANSGKVLLYKSADSSLVKQSDKIFKNYVNAAADGESLAKAAIQEKIKKATLLYYASSMGEEFNQSFKATFEKLGGQVVVDEQFDPTAQDFKTTLVKSKSNGAETIVFVGYKPQIIILTKQLEELNMQQPLFFFMFTKDILDDKNTLDYLMKRKVIISGITVDYERNDKTKAFFETYKSKFNNIPNDDAAYTYDNARILAEAMKKCENPKDTECIAKNIANINYSGLVGDNLKFNENRILISQSHISILSNGKEIKYEIK